MNNAEEIPGDTVMDPLKQESQESNPSTSDSYETGGDTMASGDESFLLEGDQASESQDDQRTSTPTKALTHFAEGESVADGQFSIQGVVLSPVLNSMAEHATPTQDQQSFTHDQPFASPGGYSTQDKSGEDSQSLYTSALSNINTTLTSDSCSAVEEKSGESSALEISVLQDTLRHESLMGECSTQDSTWATAYGSLQDDSDLKDITIRQEFNQSESNNLPLNVDETNSENNGETTFEDMTSTVEGNQVSEHVKNSDMQDVKNSDRIASVEVKSPDLDLLNEICEEATNMTIKEALICSLNPGVRAGLREGRLSLNESEILALEQYCEQFIDNLISQLLDGHWSENISKETSKPKSPDNKAKMAQKLSSLGLETLKSNCDRFVHSIITESLHDSCFGLQNEDAKSLESDKDSNAKQMQDIELDQNKFQTLFPLFKESEAIQDYIGFLAADIIKSALTNLSTSIATKNGDKNEHMTLNENSSSDNKTSREGTLCSSENKEGDQDTGLNNHMWKSQSEATPKGLENETDSDKGSESSDKEFEGQYAREMEGLSDDEQMFSSSLNGALETSLEFDGDWEGGGFLEDLHSLETGRKQRIMLKELSFDEHADVPGNEVLAPVFLAIAEENDDDTEIQGMRKKAQSIENLCGVISEPDDESFRRRSYSAPKRIRPIKTDLPPEQDKESEINKEEGDDNGEDEDGQQQEEDPVDKDHDEEEFDEQEKDIQRQDEQGQDGKGQDKTVPAVSTNLGERFRWYTVSLNGRDKILDLKLLESYMKVISHGGYFSDTKATIVVIAACYLPDRSIKNYDFLMEQLFFYVISTLELLAVHEDYYLVYLNGGVRQQNMPSVTWMKRFYQYIEGGLKKRMKEMFIVHPNFRLKAVITLAKPFLNASFWHKLSFVHSLSSLSDHVPVDYIYIPDEVMRADPAYRQVHSR